LNGGWGCRTHFERDTPRDHLCQVWLHLAKLFQRRRFFRNQPIRNKNCLWWPCLLMDRDEMSNRNRGLSIDASYQVSINKHGHHRHFLFLIGRFLKIFYSETAWPNGLKRGRKHLWKVLYGKCSFHFVEKTNNVPQKIYNSFITVLNLQKTKKLANDKLVVIYS
jgi:hypothetical protein